MSNEEGNRARAGTPKSGKKCTSKSSVSSRKKSASNATSVKSVKKNIFNDDSDEDDLDFDENDMGMDDYEDSDKDADMNMLDTRGGGDSSEDDEGAPEEMKSNAAEIQRLKGMFEEYESSLSAKKKKNLKKGKKGKDGAKDKDTAVQNMEGQLLDASVLANLDADDVYGDEEDREGEGGGEEEEEVEDPYYQNRRRVGKIDMAVKKSIRLGNEEIEVTALTGVPGQKGKDLLALYINDRGLGTHVKAPTDEKRSLLHAALDSKLGNNTTTKFSIFASQKASKGAGPARAFRTSKKSSKGGALKLAAAAAETKRIKMARRRGAL